MGRFLRSPWFCVLGLLILGAVYIAVSPPGCEQTVKEPKHPDGPPKPPMRSVDRLRASWDSEGEADWPVTELLASMSNFAYQTPAAARTSYGGLGFDQIVPVLKNSLAAYVVSSEDVAVIAFRGTDDPVDWLVNLDILPVQTPHGEMHKGFADAYETLKGGIMDALRQKKLKHLWTTGHSLGGALALVCAYDLIENEKMAFDGVITFGQPMVAGQGLADYLDKLLLGRFAHIVNDVDIVPRVPPGYSHCGSLVWFTDGGIRRSKPKRPIVEAAPDKFSFVPTDNPKPLTNAEFDQLKAELRKQNESKKLHESKNLYDGRPVVYGNTPWIRDHSMSAYLDKVRSLIGHIKQLLRR